MLVTFVLGFLVVLVVALIFRERKNTSKREVVGYVSQIRVHPVKSAQALLLNTAEITKFGILHDRQYALLDEFGKVIASARQPPLVLIKQTILNDGILLEAEGMPPLKLPLEMKTKEGSHLADVKILRATTKGVHVSDEVDRWFKEYLKLEKCQLMCFPSDGKPRFTRDGSAVYKFPDKYTNEQEMSMFANATPLLVLSESAVDEFNTQLNQPVNIGSFRPSIVIKGCKPHAEDQWGAVEIGDTALKALYPCQRCPAITVDSSNGHKDESGQPLSTLKSYRTCSSENYPEFIGKPLFGFHYGVRKVGTIAVGDPVYKIT